MTSSSDHLNVVVTHMARSMAFYGAVLGLAPVMDRELTGEWFEQVTGLPGARARCVILDAPGGGCRVELLQFHAPVSPAPPPSTPAAIGLRHMAIRVADLDVCLGILKDRFGVTVTPVQVPRDIVKSGKRMCYIRDPDGAMVELCEYGSEIPEFC
jgi:catechol 2,3-dioxygenase-like lactoylglutathione lyase family enzyme